MTRNTYEIGTDKYVPNNPICVMLMTESPLLYPAYLDMPMFQERPNIIDNEPHVTLRYGIMPEIPHYEINDLVLNTRSLHNTLETSRGVFAPFEIFGKSSDDFETVVVPIVNSAFLYSLHLELGCFPNVLTFPDFRPHITIGRFERGFWESIDPRLYPPIKQEVSVTGFKITGGGPQ